jgi:hypothetical protein
VKVITTCPNASEDGELNLASATTSAACKRSATDFVFINMNGVTWALSPWVKARLIQKTPFSIGITNGAASQ